MGQQRPGLGRNRTRRLGSSGFVQQFYGSADPRIAPGYVADPGTVLVVAGEYYWKFSTGNTDWIHTPWIGGSVVTSIDGVSGAFVTGSLNPAQIDIGDVTVLGTAATLARADHGHAFPASAVIPPAIAAAGALGVATTAARSDHTHAGVTSVEGAAGAITIVSPMKSVAGGVVTLANGNSKNLPGGFVTNDIDSDVNTAFVIPKLAGSVTVPVPKTPTGNIEDRKITFLVTSRGTAGDVVTWTTGANGFAWATQLGPLLADFNSLLAVTPNNSILKIGCNYSTALTKWIVTALAGYFT